MDSRFLVFVGLLSGFVGIAYVVARVKGGRGVTISLHAAERKDTYIVFALSLTIATICYYLFGTQYLIPTAHISAWFLPLYVILLLGILVSGWIPDIAGWKRRIHYAVGYVMILPVPLLIFLVAISDVSQVTQIISWIGTIIAIAILYLFFFVKSSHRFILLQQTIYLVTLNTVLLSAAYL